jgi:hypothetical protein
MPTKRRNAMHAHATVTRIALQDWLARATKKTNVVWPKPEKEVIICEIWLC